jgi:hypothetical protein
VRETRLTVARERVYYHILDMLQRKGGVEQRSMTIRITPHAEEQIRLRKLSRDWVMHVATNPHQTITVKGSRYFAQSRYQEEGKEFLLRVLIEEISGERWVVTVYPTSKVRKYWRGGK